LFLQLLLQTLAHPFLSFGQHFSSISAMERNFFFGSFMVLLLGFSFSSEEEHDHLYSGGSVKMRPFWMGPLL
jgi:hypothetical protein